MYPDKCQVAIHPGAGEAGRPDEGLGAEAPIEAAGADAAVAMAHSEEVAVVVTVVVFVVFVVGELPKGRCCLGGATPDVLFLA